MNFEVKMIRIKDDYVSNAYADYCAPSWRGFNFSFYDAITPTNLAEQRGINFGIKTSGRPHSPTEKACWYSQYNLWKECARANKPYLVLEHDALLVNPKAITFNPHLMVQFFGQHAMEAVMYHPAFAKKLVDLAGKTNVDKGPMGFVDTYLGFFSKNRQSRYGDPHARYQGMSAPVKSVLDLNMGNTVRHPEKETIVDRANRIDKDLFVIVDLKDYYTQ